MVDHWLPDGRGQKTKIAYCNAAEGFRLALWLFAAVCIVQQHISSAIQSAWLGWEHGYKNEKNKTKTKTPTYAGMPLRGHVYLIGDVFTGSLVLVLL